MKSLAKMTKSSSFEVDPPNIQCGLFDPLKKLKYPQVAAVPVPVVNVPSVGQSRPEWRTFPRWS